MPVAQGAEQHRVVLVNIVRLELCATNIPLQLAREQMAGTCHPLRRLAVVGRDAGSPRIGLTEWCDTMAEWNGAKALTLAVGPQLP